MELQIIAKTSQNKLTEEEETSQQSQSQDDENQDKIVEVNQTKPKVVDQSRISVRINKSKLNMSRMSVVLPNQSRLADLNQSKYGKRSMVEQVVDQLGQGKSKANIQTSFVEQGIKPDDKEETQTQAIKTPYQVKMACFLALFVSMSYWQIPPFFPSFLRNHQISPSWLGILMSISAACFLLGAFITGQCLLNHFKRLTCCLIGACFIIINLCGMGYLFFIEDRMIILSLAILFQTLGGFGMGLNHVSALAIVSSYNEEKILYVSYLEACLGLGALFGPLFGSLFHIAFGYRGPFFGLAILYSFIILISIRHNNESNDEAQANENAKETNEIEKSPSINDMESNEQQRKQKLTLRQILSVKRSSFGLITQTMNYVCLTFFMPLMSNYLDQNKFKPEFMGIAMIITSIIYLLGNVSVVMFFTKFISKRGIIVLGFSLQLVGVLISGFQTGIGMAACVLIGISFFGFGLALIEIPVMPEIIDSINESQFKGTFDEQSLNNNVAGYFITCQAIGESTGPLLASLSQYYLGIRNTQFIHIVTISGFLLIYFFICDPVNFFKLDSEVKDEEENCKKVGKQKTGKDTDRIQLAQDSQPTQETESQETES